MLPEPITAVFREIWLPARCFNGDISKGEMVLNQKFKSLLLCAALCLSTVWNAVADENTTANLGPNLLKNESFQEGLRHWRIPEVAGGGVVASRQGTVGAGQHSLQFTNTNPEVYKTVTQRIAVKPGQKVHFGGWVKGVGIKGRNGASVFLETYQGSKWLSGSYPKIPASRQGKDFDWNYVSSTFIIPENADRINVGLYFLRGSTGTVWFDELFARVEQPAFYESYLAYPNYRGLTTSDNKEAWQINVAGEIPAEAKGGRIEAVLRGAGGNVLAREQIAVGMGKYTQEITWKPDARLELGRYQWEVNFKSLDGKTTRQDTYAIEVVPQMPRVYIDSAGFAVREGKRFFPLGLFTGAGEKYNSEADLERMSEAGFNTVLSYTYGARRVYTGDDYSGAVRFMDNAHKHNMQVIYSLKDMHDGAGGSGANRYPRNGLTALQDAAGYVQRLKDHPAFLAWYTNDEMSAAWVPKLEAAYQQTKQLDPNHPVFSVITPKQIPSDYISSTDILGNDPYPIGAMPLDRVMRDTSWIVREKRGKTIWQTLQMHDQGFANNSGIKSHTPSLDEMRNVSYQALINGSKGIMYFAYHWLGYYNAQYHSSQEAFDKRWPDVKAAAQEISAFSAIVLKDHKVELERMAASTAQHQAWQDGDKLYVVVANAATISKPERLQLRIPQGWKLSGEKVRGMTPQLANGVLDIQMEAQASGAIVLVRG